MNLNRRFIYTIIGLVAIPAMLLSCSAKTEEDKKFEGLKINIGSIIDNSNGIYSNINNIDGKYEKIVGNNKEVAGLYDYNSKNYIAELDKKYIAYCDNRRINIDNIETGDNNFNLAPNGEYLFLFRTNEVKVIDLKSGEYVDFKPAVFISGKLIDWIDQNTLIYYGIKPDDKVNGIFTYNIKTGEENNIVSFKEGAAEYLKAVDNTVVYVQDKLNGEKELKCYDLNKTVETVLSSDVKKVYDILKSNEDYYVLGSFKGMNNSLYKLTSSKVKRLVYGFPGAIKLNKGLSQNAAGEILFIGSDNDENVEEIYKCMMEGAISEIYKGTKDISFLRN